MLTVALVVASTCRGTAAENGMNLEEAVGRCLENIVQADTAFWADGVLQTSHQQNIVQLYHDRQCENLDYSFDIMNHYLSYPTLHLEL